MQENLTHAKARYIRRRKRYAAPVFGLWLFLLFCCLLAAYYFMNSAYFSLQHFDVQGNSTLPAEDLIQLAGLNKGTNLFRLNTGEAAAKIELHPSVREVKIKRKLPQTVNIEIRERIPIALVPAHNGVVIVDEEGYYIRQINDFKDLKLPIISGIPVQEDATPGANISNPGLAAALSLVKLMDKSFLVNVAQIVAPTPESLALKTVQGVEIRFGKPEDLERKLHLIQTLLLDNGAVINSQTIEYIDLRYDTTPVIKRKN